MINGRPDAEVQTLDLVEANAPIKAGDELVTAGTVGGPYPSDIPVGRVTSVRQRPGDLLSRITVELYADAGTTEFVRVLEWPVP